MNTWQLIKNDITRDAKPGTVRYLERVRLGAGVYCALRPNIKDKARADRAFNADGEVTQSFVVGEILADVM